MVEIICKYCHGHVEAKRKSKMVCDKKECQNQYHAEKNREKFKKYPDKYDEHRFKQSIKNLKKDMQKWKDNNNDVTKGNGQERYIPTRTHICEECNHEYIISRYNNTTGWGAGLCPKCGLVERTIMDVDIWWYHHKYNPIPANQETIDQWRSNLGIVKIPPILKKYAVYLDEDKTQIDFIEELYTLRKILNQLKEKLNKKEITVLTTPDEEQICFNAVNRNLIENKITIKNK